MRVFIAEKPEVGRAIADVLGKGAKKKGYIDCGADVVTWMFGHLLELCVPEDYDERYAKWNLEDLPIITVPWRYKISKGCSEQMNVIKRLISKADIVVHAGDTDGEGQLLVDEVLQYYKVNKPVKRVLINDNNPRKVKQAIASMRDNREFYGLSQSALARSVGDQLYGFNMSRLYTLKAQQKGVKGVFSVGRVQTPILGLIVRRDREIEAHKMAFYYRLVGEFSIAGAAFPAVFKATGDAPLDDKGRIIDASFVENIAKQCKGQPAAIESCETRHKSEHPPLPYDLLELQADAHRKFNISPDNTLKITQSLREKRLITYNRSDCRYLSEVQHDDAPLVLKAISETSGILAKSCASAKPSIKGRCFDDRYVSAHHAIIPTECAGDDKSLSKNEQFIYMLIARQYIAQFWPNRESKVTTVMVVCEGHRFKSVSTVYINQGWAQLYKNDAGNDALGRPDEDACDINLASLVKGDKGQCTNTSVEQKETQPPKHYTKATLLKDLRRVAKYVDDPKIARLLKNKDKDKKAEQGGIGTPATRDSFIVKLLGRNFIEEKGKKLISSPLGRSFHDALPTTATRPDMTALWHEQQQEIEKGILTSNAFVKELAGFITAHVNEIRAAELSISKAASSQKAADKTATCPGCGNQVKRLKRKKGKGFFWVHINEVKQCIQFLGDKRGKPVLQAAKKAAETAACPKCGAQIKRLYSKAKDFYFWVHPSEQDEGKCQKFIKDADGVAVS